MQTKKIDLLPSFLHAEKSLSRSKESDHLSLSISFSASLIDRFVSSSASLSFQGHCRLFIFRDLDFKVIIKLKINKTKSGAYRRHDVMMVSKLVLIYISGPCCCFLYTWYGLQHYIPSSFNISQISNTLSYNLSLLYTIYMMISYI